MTNWQELESKYYMPTFNRIPVTLVRGEGMKVWDDKGKEYLDFVAGIAVNALGHCHPALTEAICQQAGTLVHTSCLYYTTPQLNLAELLVKSSVLDKVFFCNSGAEANEGALKLARKYGKVKLNGANEIITTLNSFHGRTLMTLAATGQPKFQEPYKPMPGGFISVAYNDIEAIKKATSKKTCAIMLEPIQGEGGVNMSDQDYLKKVRAWCDEKGILLILDEIQTGIGRMGPLFGYEVYDVEPDIITLAKGLGSGFPIGVFMAKDEASVFEVGDHGSTFGGNPLACAAGYATLKYILDNHVLSNVKEVGYHLVYKLEQLKTQFDFVTEVRGCGLLIAMQFDKDIAADVMNACMADGLLINKLKPNAIRFIPPLIVSKADVDEAVGILYKVLSNI
ncbi:MAG: acetylornithine transaminase [Chloroflexi bacterium]|jgi:acetylornithine/N-succinyldiaminopimelate aminotransferase|nr:acetylornithine transaminase [Chloroflexota bacterium]MBT7080443.1 acetylornithine transaminase [Chloroflexota bacterium]